MGGKESGQALPSYLTLPARSIAGMAPFTSRRGWAMSMSAEVPWRKSSRHVENTIRQEETAAVCNCSGALYWKLQTHVMGKNSWEALLSSISIVARNLGEIRSL